MRLAMLLAVTAVLLGCGNQKDQNPDAQQLARINQELATLTARMDALARRMDAMEGNRNAPGTQAASPGTASTAPAPQNDEPPLMVTVGETLLLGGQTVTNDALAAALREHADRDANATLVIETSPGTSQGRITEIIDLAKQNGIKNLLLRDMPASR